LAEINNFSSKTAAISPIPVLPESSLQTIDFPSIKVITIGKAENEYSNWYVPALDFFFQRKYFCPK